MLVRVSVLMSAHACARLVFGSLLLVQVSCLLLGVIVGVLWYPKTHKQQQTHITYTLEISTYNKVCNVHVTYIL